MRRSRPVPPGRIIKVPRGAVHDLIATSSAALTLHVHSPALSYMRYFDLDGMTFRFGRRMDKASPWPSSRVHSRELEPQSDDPVSEPVLAST
jgi:hypothetical protein